MTSRVGLNLVIAISLLASAGICTPVNALAASPHNHVRIVHFTFRNDTDAEVSIRCGDQLISVKAKGSVALALPEGSKVVAEHSFATYSAGDVLVRVEKSFDRNTVSVH